MFSDKLTKTMFFCSCDFIFNFYEFFPKCASFKKTAKKFKLKSQDPKKSKFVEHFQKINQKQRFSFL